MIGRPPLPLRCAALALLAVPFVVIAQYDALGIQIGAWVHVALAASLAVALAALYVVRDWFASLRLTVTLLALWGVLIFLGTLAQTEQGIWDVVGSYFRSMTVFVPLDVFRPLSPIALSEPIPQAYGFWFPGGFLLLGLLVLNLLAAHSVRYKVRARGSRLWQGIVWTGLSAVLLGLTVGLPPVVRIIQQDVVVMLAVWALPIGLGALGVYRLFGSRKAGIVLIHLGLTLMLLGEFVTGLAAEEGQMPITERGASRVVRDVREVELAFVTPAADGNEKHVVIAQRLLERAAKNGSPITHPELPLEVIVQGYLPNSSLRPVGYHNNGLGDLQFEARDAPRVSGTQANTIDQPSAYVQLRGGGISLPRQLVSVNELVRPVRFEAEGRRWRAELRFKRTYLPYTIQLHDFRNDTFTGSRVARNFSSDLRVVAADGAPREAFIRMNQPLRYEGLTFYQSGFYQGPLNRNTGTVLQVAGNPGSWIPYLSCVIVTVGLCWQFGASLARHTRRTSARGTR